MDSTTISLFSNLVFKGVGRNPKRGKKKLISLLTNDFEMPQQDIIDIYRKRWMITNEAVIKSVYLAVREASKKWNKPIPNWGLIINQFMTIFAERAQL